MINFIRDFGSDYSDLVPWDLCGVSLSLSIGVRLYLGGAENLRRKIYNLISTKPHTHAHAHAHTHKKSATVANICYRLS